MISSSSLSQLKIAAILTVLFGSLSVVLSIVPVSDIGHAVLCAGLVACGIVMMRCTRKIENSIEKTRLVCDRISKGDFEARITHITDFGKIGELQWTINRMVDLTDAFVREATASMDYVAKNQYFRRIFENGLNGALQYGAKAMNAATNSVQQKMDSFATVAEDLDKALTSVAGNTDRMVGVLQISAQTMRETVHKTRDDARHASAVSNETRDNVQAISAASTQMSATISEISEQMQRVSGITKNAVTQSTDAGGIMQDLNQTVRQVSDITIIIEDIAEQTNLLALNATIEAARAGEVGKGFAVVASEVKNLAAQTAEATERISALIRAMEVAVGKADDSFSAIGSVITQINETTTVVAAAVEEQNAAFQEIARNTERTSQGTDDVASTIVSMEQGVGAVDETAKSVATVTHGLSTEVAPQVNALLLKMGGFMEELKKIA